MALCRPYARRNDAVCRAMAASTTLPAMTTALQRAVAAAIAAALPEGTMDANEVAQSLGRPPDPTMGDLAFPCFKLAKALRKAPPVIATDVAAALAHAALFTEVRPAGAYVNLRL